MHRVLAKYEESAESRLIPYFNHAKVHFPPKQIALLAFKKEQRVELWAKNHDNRWHFIRIYPLKANSGGPGPKLRQNDRQIPEGIYQIIVLNPFSAWHLSMKINYPNAFDTRHAILDGRSHLGGDIFIHGGHGSAGCLAMGDRAIEELFTLVSLTGKNHVKVIIAPNDLRHAKPVKIPHRHPNWVAILDNNLHEALQAFHLENSSYA